ncbi:MAG TPA: hypothetical protein VLE91_00205 [Candidatus Saccharimonadales bacterium]|nr:hypothetical protein [Candidatus Saccharimonadales bacterium]
MSEVSIESSIGNTSPEYMDVRDPKYKLHWTPIGKLSGVLNKGILSPSFALRVSDSGFDPTPGTASNRVVHLYSAGDSVQGEPEQVVGILVKDSQKIREVISAIDLGRGVASGINLAHLRVAPRDFVALVVADEVPGRGLSRLGLRNYFTRRNIWNRIDKIRKIAEESGQPFTIYGNSGDMYWPKKMARQAVIATLKSQSQ